MAARTALSTVLLLAAVLWLSACAPSEAPEDGTPSASASSPAPTVAPSTPSADPAPTPDPVPTLTAEDRQSIQEAISSGSTAALEGYLADASTFVLAGSEYGFEGTPRQVADEIAGRLAGHVWTPATAAGIAVAQASFYGPDYFPADVIVLVSEQDDYIALSPLGDEIVTVLFGGGWSTGL